MREVEGDRLAGDEIVGHRPRRCCSSWRLTLLGWPRGPGRLRGSPSGDWDRLEEPLRAASPDRCRGRRDPGPVPARGHASSLVRSTTPDPRSSPTSRCSWRGRGPARPGPGHGLVGRRPVLRPVLPAALYRMRWWWITVLVVDVLLAVVMGWWLLEHSIESSLASRSRSAARRERLRELLQRVRRRPFALRVWTNNFWLSALCIASGVFLPAGPLHALHEHAQPGGRRLDHGAARPGGALRPHRPPRAPRADLPLRGGRGGLRLFWSWVSPVLARAPRPSVPRAAALGTALGLVVLLLLCGVIEAFVTPSPPTCAVGIGVLAEAAFFTYVHRRPVGPPARRERRRRRGRAGLRGAGRRLSRVRRRQSSPRLLSSR